MTARKFRGRKALTIEQRRRALFSTQRLEAIPHKVGNSSLQTRLESMLDLPGLSDRIRHLKLEGKPDWKSLFPALFRRCDSCIAALNAPDVAQKLAECDASLEAHGNGHRASTIVEWETRCKDWRRLIADKCAKIGRLGTPPWRSALEPVFGAWLQIGQVHEDLHQFEDVGCARVFNLNETAHAEIHEVIWALERIMLYPYVWE